MYSLYSLYHLKSPQSPQSQKSLESLQSLQSPQSPQSLQFLRSLQSLQSPQYLLAHLTAFFIWLHWSSIVFSIFHKILPVDSDTNSNPFQSSVNPDICARFLGREAWTGRVRRQHHRQALQGYKLSSLKFSNLFHHYISQSSSSKFSLKILSKKGINSNDYHLSEPLPTEVQLIWQFYVFWKYVTFAWNILRT